MVGLVDAGGDLLEREAIRRVVGPGGASPKQRRPEQGRGSRYPERAAHDVAAVVAIEDDVAHRVAGGRAQRHIVVGLISLSPVAETVGFRHMRGSISV